MRVTTGNTQGLQLVNASYPVQGGTPIVTAPAGKQLLVHSMTVYNSSSSAVDVGLGVQLEDTGSAIYSALTGSSLSKSAFSLFSTSANSGIIVQAKSVFGYVSFSTVAPHSGSPVYTYEYWNGLAWASLSPYAIPSFGSSGLQCLVFSAPIDWAQGNGSFTADLNSYQVGYCVRIRATTAPGVAVSATSLKVAKLWAVRNLSAKSHLAINFELKPYLLDSQESLVPFFSSALGSNTVEVAYQVGG